MTKAKGKEGQQTKGSNKTQGSSQTSSNRDKKNQGAKISEQSSNIKSVEQAGGDCSTGKPVNKPKLKGKTSAGDQSRGITCGRVCYFLMAVMIASAAGCIAYIYMNESNEQLLGQLDDARKEITHHAFKLLEKLRSYVDAEVVSKEKTEQEKEDLERHEQDAQEKVVRENIAKELAAKEKAAKEQAAKEQAAREQAAKEHVEREQAARERAGKEQAEREQAAREEAGKEQAEREQAAREQAAQAIRVDIPDQEIQDP